MTDLSVYTRTILSQSYPLLRENCEDICYRMYDLLFREQPALRSMFGQSRKHHPDLFCTIFQPFAENQFRITGEFEQLLVELSHTHAHRGISESHYNLLCDCLLQAMEDVLFDEVTPDIRNAWNQACHCLSTYCLREYELLSEPV